MMLSTSSLLVLLLFWPEPSKNAIEVKNRSSAEALSIVPATANVPRQPLMASLSTTSNQSTISGKGLDLQAYNLMWSKGAMKKAVLALTTSWAGHVGFRYLGFAKSSLPTPVSHFVLPMLASSCCLLQIALNFLSVGCAGFNTILGPTHPYFIGFQGYLSIVSGGILSIRLLSALFLRWSISLLPEAIHLWNNWRSRTTAKDTSRGKTFRLEATVHVDIPTMGCVACINSINSALTKVPHVLSASSSLHPLGMKGGKVEAKVHMNDKSDVAMINGLIVRAIEEAGFGGGSVVSTKFSEKA